MHDCCIRGTALLEYFKWTLNYTKCLWRGFPSLLLTILYQFQVVRWRLLGLMLWSHTFDLWSTLLELLGVAGIIFINHCPADTQSPDLYFSFAWLITQSFNPLTVTFVMWHLGLHLLCLNFNLLFFKNLPKFSILLCLSYYFKIILRKYTCIRNTSFKIIESNIVQSLVLAANCNQGTIWLFY